MFSTLFYSTKNQSWLGRISQAKDARGKKGLNPFFLKKKKTKENNL